jgi:Zn-dependent protease
MVCFIILGSILVFIRLFWPETLTLNYAAPFSAVSIVGPPFAKWLTIIVVDIKQLFYTSLVLGIFNLIPIPPLDGSWILSGLLPQKMHLFFEGIRKFSFVIFLLLVVTPVLDYILVVPLGLVYTAFEILVTVAGLG